VKLTYQFCNRFTSSKFFYIMQLSKQLTAISVSNLIYISYSSIILKQTCTHFHFFFLNLSLQVFLHPLVLVHFKTSFISSDYFNIETCDLIRDGQARHMHHDSSVLKTDQLNFDIFRSKGIEMLQWHHFTLYKINVLSWKSEWGCHQQDTDKTRVIM